MGDLKAKIGNDRVRVNIEPCRLGDTEIFCTDDNS